MTKGRIYGDGSKLKPTGSSATENQTDVIDCDVHVRVPSVEALHPYLSDHWCDYLVESGLTGQSLEPNYYPPESPLSARPGTKRDSDQQADSDFNLLREQLLDTLGLQSAILNCVYGVQTLHNPDLAAAMASAVNDWQIAEWLEKDSRLRASIVVSTQDLEAAVQEIERLATHPGFVQILLLVRSEMPYGKRYYWPIYEAAERCALPIGIHAGGYAGNPPTPVGWPSYYLEEYVGLVHAFQSQVLSLVSEGVFAKFPGLRVVLIESGFTWLPAFMWRFDKDWKGIRREVPWVDKLPSEIIKEHFRITVQPFDEPSSGKDEYLLEIMEQISSDKMLLFSTDYPHWHFDDLQKPMPVTLPEESRRKIMTENPQAVYGL